MSIAELTIAAPWAIAVTVLCGFTCLVHAIVGTREVRSSLNTLDEQPRLTLMFAWHATTLTLVVMTFGYAAPLFMDGAAGAFLASLALTALVCFLGIAMNLTMRISSWTVLPQWILFALIGGCGAFALV